jgi:hypothetical protein
MVSLSFGMVISVGMRVSSGQINYIGIRLVEKAALPG